MLSLMASVHGKTQQLQKEVERGMREYSINTEQYYLRLGRVLDLRTLWDLSSESENCKVTWHNLMRISDWYILIGQKSNPLFTIRVTARHYLEKETNKIWMWCIWHLFLLRTGGFVRISYYIGTVIEIDKFLKRRCYVVLVTFWYVFNCQQDHRGSNISVVIWKVSLQTIIFADG